MDSSTLTLLIEFKINTGENLRVIDTEEWEIHALQRQNRLKENATISK